MDKAQDNAAAGRIVTREASVGSTDTERWMTGFGTKFLDVWFLVKGEQITERHVADPETISTTIDMSASRFGAKAAVWADHDPALGWWCWCFRDGPTVGNARVFPTREAAEMFALHRG